MDVGRVNPPVNRNRIITDRSSVNDTKGTDVLEMQNRFGGKDLDQVLNGMSDPKYIQKKTRLRGVGNDELGKDAFLKLMMAQLKQQDPTNPLKSHEMAAQLAQFSSVEQLTNIRTAIEDLGKKENHDQFQLLSLIGKEVSGDSAQIRRTLGDSEHQIEFKVPVAADRAIVRIKNATGQEVKKYEMGNLKAGKNIISWNGLKNDDTEAPVGQYRVEIEASKAGKTLKVQTKFSGPVDGVTFAKGGPLLTVGGKRLALRDIQSVSKGKEQAPALPGPMGQPMAAAGVPNPANLQGLPPQLQAAMTNPMAPKPTQGGLAAVAQQQMGAAMNGSQSLPKGQAPRRSQRVSLQPENKDVFKKPHLKHPQVKVDHPVRMDDMNKRFSKGAYEAPRIQDQMAELKMAGELQQKLMGVSKQL